MTKIVKSISLDAETAPIANEKENFSAWVRQQLLTEIQYTKPCVFFDVVHRDRFGKTIYDSGEDGRKHPRITSEICNGQKKPHCPKCYPHGMPDREDWLEYANARIDRKELLARAEKTWKWRTDQIEAKKASKNQEKVSPMGGVKPKRAYVRRLLTWIWSYIW